MENCEKPIGRPAYGVKMKIFSHKGTAAGRALALLIFVIIIKNGKTFLFN